MAVTYERINSTTLSSTATDVTFSSIPATYTDLILVSNYKIVTGGDLVLQHQLNADTGTNYSYTYFLGTGSAGVSGGGINATEIDNGYFARNDGNFTTCVTNFFSYTNTSHNKSILSMSQNHNGNQTAVYSNLWRSNSAINSIKTFSASGRTYAIGSTFTLYGILAA